MRFPGMRGLVLLAAAALTGGLMSTPASAAEAPPACPILDQMVSAGNYWVTNGTNLAPADWQNATFHVGNLALVRTTGQSNHKTLPWAQANKYLLPFEANRPFFADNEAAGEPYFDLWTYFHPELPLLNDLRKRITDEVASVQAGHKNYWNYVDALNMAMPSFARLGLVDQNPSILDAMQTLFHYTEKEAGGRGLFNEFTGLWYRDARFVGTGTFWSRGNGWALAALTKVLQVLPATDPRRPEYLRVFKRMAFTLSMVQRPDGYTGSGDPDGAVPLAAGRLLELQPAQPARPWWPGEQRDVVLRLWHRLGHQRRDPGRALVPAGRRPGVDRAVDEGVAAQRFGGLRPDCRRPAGDGQGDRHDGLRRGCFPPGGPASGQAAGLLGFVGGQRARERSGRF